jgi:hypothetical protein
MSDISSVDRFVGEMSAANPRSAPTSATPSTVGLYGTLNYVQL